MIITILLLPLVHISFSYELSCDEKLEALELLFTLRTPSCYSGNIRSPVDMPEKKLNSIKSHDCHVMMTQILPVAIRNVLPKPVRETLMRLCSFFNAISQKVINPDTLDGLQLEVVKTLCQLEMYFPSSFFDIMVHLIVHIVCPFLNPRIFHLVLALIGLLAFSYPSVHGG
jgi:hypothetical protein